jgi:hypothetical protein
MPSRHPLYSRHAVGCRRISGSEVADDHRELNGAREKLARFIDRGMVVTAPLRAANTTALS